MFGEGISLPSLIQLLSAIRAKELTLQVKVLDAPWEDISSKTISNMLGAITKGAITNTDDIRLRLFAKDGNKAA